MKRTGAWWEMVANWFAGKLSSRLEQRSMTRLNFILDTAMNSPLCEKARKQHGRPEGKTIIRLDKVIGSSHQVIGKPARQTILLRKLILI
jgi:hypothetical protein